MNALALFRRGFDTSRIADRLKISEADAYNALHQQREVARSQSDVVAVPLWVPNDLVAQYVTLASKHGEEEAARHIRRIKRESLPA